MPPETIDKIQALKIELRRLAEKIDDLRRNGGMQTYNATMAYKEAYTRTEDAIAALDRIERRDVSSYPA